MKLEKTSVPGIFRRRGLKGKVSYVLPLRDLAGKTFTLTFPTFDEAKDAKHEHEKTKRAGIAIDRRAGNVQFGEYGDDQMPAILAEVNSVRTRSGYARAWRRLKSGLGNYTLAKLEHEPVILHDYFKRLGVHQIGETRAVLRHLLYRAQLERRITSIPTIRIEKSKRSKGLRAIEPDEVPTDEIVAAIIDAISDRRSLTIVRFLAGTGCRWAEMAGLQWDRVDLLHERVWIDETLVELGGRLFEHQPTKSREPRWVDLPPFVVDDLKAMMEAGQSSGYVFTSESGRPLRHSNFRNRQKIPALERAGVGHWGAHSLRHYAASTMLSAGVNPVKVAKQLATRTRRSRSPSTRT